MYCSLTDAGIFGVNTYTDIWESDKASEQSSIFITIKPNWDLQ